MLPHIDNLYKFFPSTSVTNGSFSIAHPPPAARRGQRRRFAGSTTRLLRQSLEEAAAISIGNRVFLRKFDRKLPNTLNPTTAIG
ncbi:MAG: hypothetical protein HC942_15380 [Microcoleus sp. SU_5_6]|nr:hypothetical protein [Microcoleus sp. SU_5_6]